MNNSWHKAESTVKPQLVEQIDSYIYLRKNIVEEKRKDEIQDAETVCYTYDECVLTTAEYSKILTDTLDVTNSNLSDLESLVADYIGGNTDVA